MIARRKSSGNCAEAGTEEVPNARKPSFSFANGNCFLVSNFRERRSARTGGVLVRDSKDIAGAVLQIPAGAWSTFLESVRG